MSNEGQGWDELVKLIMDATVSAAIGWPVGKILDLVLDIVRNEVSAIETKLDRHMSAPFREAEKLLRYAKATQNKKEQEELYKKARDCFNTASENLTGLESAKSTLLVATMFDILGNHEAAKEAHHDALKAVKKAYEEKIDELNQKRARDPASWFSAIIGGAGAGTASGSIGIGVILLIIGAPAAFSLLTLSAVGAGFAGVGFGSLKLIEKHKILRQYEQIQEIKEFKGLPIFDQFKNQSKSPDVKLLSEKSLDYNDLQTFLLERKWQEADLATKSLILELTDRELLGFLLPEDFEKAPCADLHSMEQLWEKYSQGRFGFRVQKRIYQEIGYSFGELEQKVGWFKNNLFCISYAETAPQGHLPVCAEMFFIRQSRVEFDGTIIPGGLVRLDKRLIRSLFHRLESCQVH